MNTQSRLGATIGAAVLAIALLAGCTPASSDSPTGNPTTSPGSPTQPTGSTIDWGDRPQEPVELDGGFAVVACEGEGPLLCVEKDGEQVGMVEYFTFGSPGDIEAVRALIDDDYSSFTSDREGCADGYTVETVEPAEVEIAGMPGLRSSYAVLDADGQTVERYIKYWTVSDGMVHLLNAEAQDEGSCYPAEGVTFAVDVLGEFEPSYELLAERSAFPAAGL